MTEVLKAKITGTGMFVPDLVRDNRYYENFFETSDEWIRTRTGIEERRYAEAHMATSDLAFEAAKNAMEAAECTAEDLDLIIMATLSPDYAFPGSGVIVQRMLGLETTPAIDLRAQCSGFMFGISTAQAYIQSGMYKKILVIGAEIHSKLKDMKPLGRDVSVLFGDGAGAAIIEPSTDDTGILSTHIHSQGEFAEKLYIPRPGTKGQINICEEDIIEGKQFVQMEGKAVFRHATTRFREVILEGLEANSMKIEDVDHFIFHQANIRICEAVANTMEVPMSKVHTNIAKYGNCSAASIPMLLDECVRDGRIKKGDTICLASFGSGFMWASSIIKW